MNEKWRGEGLIYRQSYLEMCARKWGSCTARGMHNRRLKTAELHKCWAMPNTWEEIVSVREEDVPLRRHNTMPGGVDALLALVRAPPRWVGAPPIPTIAPGAPPTCGSPTCTGTMALWPSYPSVFVQPVLCRGSTLHNMKPSRTVMAQNVDFLSHVEPIMNDKEFRRIVGSLQYWHLPDPI